MQIERGYMHKFDYSFLDNGIITIVDSGRGTKYIRK